MKVLQINAVNKIGSTGRNCYEIEKFLIKKGNKCVTACSVGENKNSENEFIIGNKLDVKIHGIFSRISGMQGYFSLRETKKLLNYMDNFIPDIVLLGNLHGNYINLPILLKYLAEKNIATVVVLHDCWFYTGKCCHYTIDKCYKWQKECGNCPSLKKYNKSWFFDKTKKMFNDKKELFSTIPRLAVIGVSNWITQEASKAPIFKNAKYITRIYNWIDLDKFYPRNIQKLKDKLELKNEKILLCVASNWTKEKGIETILELSTMLNTNEKMIIIGNIDRKIKLNKKIIHVSMTNSIDILADYYSLADVFIQPSLEETFGKVSAEALACGTPIVCFNSTANTELVGEGCGVVVEVGDMNKFYQGIEEILNNGKKSYKKNCINFAKKNFNKDININNYVDLFEKILKC